MKRIRRSAHSHPRRKLRSDAFRLLWHSDHRRRCWSDCMASASNQARAEFRLYASGWTKTCVYHPPEERATFLGLETDAERVQFIEQFWKRRDPTPDTPGTSSKKNTTGGSHRPTCAFRPRRARRVGRPTGDAPIFCSGRPMKSTIIRRATTWRPAKSRLWIGPIGIWRASAPTLRWSLWTQPGHPIFG